RQARAAGALVPGARMANCSALAAARHAVLAGQDWDVEADGLFGAPPITVVIGEEARPTPIKALGRGGLRRTPRARAAARGARAVNLNTGAFDPLTEIAERTQDVGAWLHVDGAFGLWAAAAAG